MDFGNFPNWYSFVWGLVVLLALIGWGCALVRLLERSRLGEWDFAAAYGMGVVIALGGLLAVFGLASRYSLIGIALVGVVFASLWFRPGGWDWGTAGVVGVALAVWYVPSVTSSVASGDFEPYDDFLAYIPFAKRLLDTGTLIEPFGYRRLATFGGHTLLSAMTVAFGGARNMNLLDSGIAMVILAGLVWRTMRGMVRRRGWALAMTAAFLVIPVVRHNTMSQATGIVVWIGLAVAVQTRSAVMAGVMLAALCSLRGSYLAPALLVTAWLLVKEFPLWWRAAVAAALSILPWCLLLYRSSGTIAYPVWRGFEQPGMSLSAAATAGDLAAAVGRLLSDPNVWVLLAPLLAMMVIDWRMKRSATAFAAAAVATLLMVPLFLPFSDGSSVYRYVQPLALGSVLIVIPWLLHERRKVAIGLGIAAVPFLLMYATVTFGTLTAKKGNAAELYPADAVGRYRALEQAVPAGEAVYCVLPLPFLLDYGAGRTIYIADMIGFASPPPGLPFFAGPEAVKRYLLGLGIRYVAFNDFDHPQVETGYWRWWWRERAVLQNPTLKPSYRQVLDLMDNVDRLAESEGVVWRDGDLRLVRLR